jgi:FdhE protein
MLVRKAAQADGGYFESLSETVPIGGDGLLFIGFQTGRPFFEMIAEDISKSGRFASWGKAICPVCGHEPDMARFEREDGRRILHCPLCDSQWAFRRLQCPFCLNDNQDSLRFFFVDQKSPYRVDVCDKCGRYIKAVDERKLGEGRTVRFVVEDIATFDLDMAAWEEGFRQPDLHVPGTYDATDL